VNYKGIVSSKEGQMFKVFIKEKAYLTGLIPRCVDVSDLQVGDEVVVSFFGNNLIDGAIVGLIKRGG
jgi:hypothetical protein